MKTISNKILVYLLISLSFVFTARYFYAIHIRTQFETERLKQHSIRVCERLALFSVKPIKDKDLSLIQTNINAEALDENISSIRVLDQNNRLYGGVVRINGKVHTDTKNQFLNLGQDSIVRPVLDNGKLIGKVVLYPNTEPLEQLLGKMKVIFMLELSVFFLIISLIMFFVLKRVVINPLLFLKNWVSMIDVDKTIPEPKIFHSTEIDTIIDSITQLTNRLISANEEILSKSNQISEKESLISSISTNLPEGMIYRLITNADGSRKFTYLSGSFEKIYGFSPEEGMADPMIVFGSVVKADIQSLLDREAESARSLSIFKCEVRMVNPDGTIRVSRFVSIPTVLEDGSISWDGVELDITDLKKAQTDLHQNQFLLTSIAEGLPDSVFAKDLNGCYLFVNSALAKRAGKQPHELLGKTNSVVFIDDDANKTMDMDFEVMRSGKTLTFEEELTTTTERMTFLTTKGPIKDEGGNIIGLFGIARDITERKLVELELQKLNLDKDRFISILGHDLRGPVNSIVGLLDILVEDLQSMSMKQIKEAVDITYQSAKKTSKLLDDVLLWATAKSGKMKFDLQKINFKENSMAVVELLQFAADSKNIKIELFCDDSLEVFADKNMLDTVVRNLISNAIKFTPEGGKIILKAQKDHEKTIISITDNGVGISAGDIEKIFDKAQLFTSIGTNAEKGSGFGLKLCQEFVEKHDGKIWVESEVEKGTAFYFSMPNAE